MSLFKKLLTRKISVFFLKIIVFIAILFSLDFSIGNTLKYFYFNQSHGWNYRILYTIDSAKADIVIIGSSTANHHYDPRIFEKRLGSSTYNGGFDGSNIFHHYAVLLSILKRCTPKVVILDFNAREFQEDPSAYDKLSNLLPYYKNNPDISQIVDLRSPFEKIKSISRIYPFNSLLFNLYIKEKVLNQPRKDDRIDIDGYIPDFNFWNKPIEKDTSAAIYQLDHQKINYLNLFIEKCNEKNIKLYIIISPRYFIHSQEDTSVKIVRTMAQSHHFKLFDFEMDTVFWNHREFFGDRIHLNYKGADYFSNQVVDSILSDKGK